MVNRLILPLIAGLVILFCTINFGSCLNGTEESRTPGGRIDALLARVESHVKNKGLPKEYAKITNKDTLESRVFYDCSLTKSYAITFMAVTEVCLKERKKTSIHNSEFQTKFEKDSIYLSMIKLKLKEINQQFIDNGDPTVLDAVIRIEKTKLLMYEMDKICPLDNKEERAE